MFGWTVGKKHLKKNKSVSATASELGMRWSCGVEIQVQMFMTSEHVWQSGKQTKKMKVVLEPNVQPHLIVIHILQSTQNEKLWVYAKYLYDAWGQRVRLMELGNYQNKSFTYDALLLFREVTKANTRTSQIFVLVGKSLLIRFYWSGDAWGQQHNML